MPIFLITIRLLVTAMIGVFVYCIIRFKTSAINKKRPIEDFIDKEREANSARRRDIDPALFFKADMSVLPAPNNSPAADKAARLAAATMIHFPQPVSNHVLKLSYGPGQLESIAQYEENYHHFIRALLDWAEELLKQGQREDALTVLEYTVEHRSEYRKSYILTADLYAEAKNTDKLNTLKNNVESMYFNDPHVQKTIIHYIEESVRGISARVAPG